MTTAGNVLPRPPGDAPTLPLLLVGVGGYMLWFGIHYWRDQTTIWPSTPVKSVLQGNGLPAPDHATPVADQISSAGAGDGGSGGSGGGNYPGGPVPSGQAQNIAKLLLSRYGWSGGGNFDALKKLWTRESGWNPKARNGSSGAFGIAQALGHGTANTAAPDGTNEYGGYGLTDAQAQKANAGDARWQIVWGLNYIKSTYGSPAKAWAHEVAAGWY